MRATLFKTIAGAVIAAVLASGCATLELPYQRLALPTLAAFPQSRVDDFTGPAASATTPASNAVAAPASAACAARKIGRASCRERVSTIV